MIVAIIVAVLAIGGFLFSRSAFGSTGGSGSSPIMDTLFPSNQPVTSPTISPDSDPFIKWGSIYGVDPALTKAIATVESSLNPSAVNAADHESLGLMQVLCRPDGNGGCLNRFDVDGWEDATREKLLTPDFNVKIGTQIIAWNIRTFGLPKAIAVYNKYNERTSPQNGPFVNQAYVDRVNQFYERYKA